MRNEAIVLEFSLKYDDGAPLKLGPGAKCPPSWHPCMPSFCRSLRRNITNKMEHVYGSYLHYNAWAGLDKGKETPVTTKEDLGKAV